MKKEKLPLIVEVSGGCLVAVYLDKRVVIPGKIEVQILDWDETKENEEADARCEAVWEEAKKLKRIY